MTPRERNPQIQALRALAAVLVLIYHAHWLDGGYIGVDIFYVISGFLITGILLRELEEKKTIALLAFYARRIRRLLPASFLVILTTGIVGFFLLPASMRQTFGRDLIAASTYISNFLFAHWSNDYQNLDSTPSPFIHFWSLAVEEQFYIFWPLFILILFRIGKHRAVLYGVMATLLGSFFFSLYLTERAPIWSFYILPTRAWELAAGALLVFLPELKRKQTVLVLISIGVIIVSSYIFDDGTPFPGWAALAPVIATALLIVSRGQWPSIINMVGKSTFVQWLGAISYPLYLWHWPVLVIPAIYFKEDLTIYQTTALLTFTLTLADLTYRWVEKPIQIAKFTSPQIFTFGAAATLISIVIGSIIYLQQPSAIALGNGFTASLEEVRSKPMNYSDGCHLNIGETVSPRCEYGDHGSRRTIVLYGDSHAAQWLPGLDLLGRKMGIKIVSLTKSACPSAEVIKETSAQYDVDDCQSFRDSSVKRINEIRPLAVIMSGLKPATAPYSSDNANSWWLAGEKKALERIKKATQFPIYLRDTPISRVDIPDCLVTAKSTSCDLTRPDNFENAAGLIPLDPIPWLCQENCSAVIDGVIAYRDRSHLTVEMSKRLSSKLELALARMGLF
jgi:peptidoglycan/LPS O-acetylase OafA/YrhL